jgi:membrane-bound inhibitor of C-type lysozyme
MLLLVTGCTDADRPASVPDTAARSAEFVCSEGTTISVSYVEEGSVRVTVGDREPIRLPQAVSASGARYADGENEIWEAKGETRVTLVDGTKLDNCRRQ